MIETKYYPAFRSMTTGNLNREQVLAASVVGAVDGGDLDPISAGFPASAAPHTGGWIEAVRSERPFGRLRFERTHKAKDQASTGFQRA